MEQCSRCIHAHSIFASQLFHKLIWAGIIISFILQNAKFPKKIIPIVHNVNHSVTREKMDKYMHYD